jgi:DNA-binding HxlR family transcriptional regulator
MSASQTSQASIAGARVGEVLRLFSAGAPGEILLALREGPIQTKVLTHQVKGYTPRTIYRYLPRLADLGAVERDDDPSGSARVQHALNGDSGAELSALIDRFASASMRRLPNGQIDSREWASLGLLADLWEAGVLEALSHGPTSPTELTRGLRCLSYHQLNRRASRFKASGFFCESRQARRQRRCYALTRKARRTMGLIAGIGRWRERHSAEAGLTIEEMATVLRVLLPLAEAPQGAGEAMEVRVDDSGEAVEVCDGESAARVTGTPEEWMAVLLDGELRVEMRGDPAAARRWLSGVYDELWAPA